MLLRRRTIGLMCLYVLFQKRMKRRGKEMEKAITSRARPSNRRAGKGTKALNLLIKCSSPLSLAPHPSGRRSVPMGSRKRGALVPRPSSLALRPFPTFRTDVVPRVDSFRGQYQGRQRAPLPPNPPSRSG